MSSSRKKVALIDYGMGNLFSVARALEHCDAEVLVTADPKLVTLADRVLLPGVGAFAQGMKFLTELGLADALREFARTGRPLMGICLGMQMLFDESEEFGATQGLGIIAGKVVQIPSTDSEGKPHKIPHIGWSPLLYPESRSDWSGTILSSIRENQSAYFLHSFAAQPANPKTRLADTEYNGRILCAAVQGSGNVWGSQFHPEKSGRTGLEILRQFVSL